MKKSILFVLMVCVVGGFTASVAQAKSVSAQRCVLTPVFLLKSVKDQTISGTWQQRRDLLKFIHKATGEDVEIANDKKEFLAEFFAIWHIAPKSLPANYPWPIPVHGVSSDWKYWAAVPRDACGYETLIQKGKNGTVRRFARMKEGFYKVGGGSSPVDQKSVGKLGGNVITVRSGGLTRADLESSSKAIQDAIKDYSKEVLDTLGENKQKLNSLKVQIAGIGDALGQTRDVAQKTQKEVKANGRVLEKTHEAVSGNHKVVSANSSALQQNQKTLGDIQQTLKRFVDSAKKSDVKASDTSYNYWWGFLILGILVLCSVFFRRK